jgi:FkbM family methyltransferase
MKKYNKHHSNFLYIFRNLIKHVLVKHVLEKIISRVFAFLAFSKIRFIRRVVFETSKNFSNYIYLETECENFFIFTKDNAISKHYYIENIQTRSNNLELLKFKKTIKFLNNNFDGKYNIDTLFDVGANIGIICIPALINNIVKKAYAIEPDKNNFRLLSINKLLNELDDNLQLYNYALSSKDNEILNFELSDDNYGDHRVSVEKPQYNLHNEGNRIVSKVESKTFDTLFPNINSKKDLVWIDTQGFEPIIIEGAKNLLISKAPIVIEFWPYGLKRNNLWTKMRELIEKFDHFCDLSEDIIVKKKINKENLEKLFTGWDQEKVNQHALYTDLLLIND